MELLTNIFIGLLLAAGICFLIMIIYAVIVSIIDSIYSRKARKQFINYLEELIEEDKKQQIEEKN